MGLNSALSPVVYGDIALNIKINTQILSRDVFCMFLLYFQVISNLW